MINLSNIINIDLLTTFTQGIKETLFDTNKKIKTSYIPNTGNIKSINADGTAITYTKDDGSVGSFTTQDTTVNVQDNLNSTITSDALSANQGRILKEMITSVSGVKFYQTSITVNVPSTNQNGGSTPPLQTIDISAQEFTSAPFVSVNAVTQSTVQITDSDDDTADITGYYHVSTDTALDYYNAHKDDGNGTLGIRSWQPDTSVRFVSTDKIIFEINQGTGFEGGDYQFVITAIGK